MAGAQLVDELEEDPQAQLAGARLVDQLAEAQLADQLEGQWYCQLGEEAQMVGATES